MILLSDSSRDVYYTLPFFGKKCPAGLYRLPPTIMGGICSIPQAHFSSQGNTWKPETGCPYVNEGNGCVRPSNVHLTGERSQRERSLRPRTAAGSHYS